MINNQDESVHYYPVPEGSDPALLKQRIVIGEGLDFPRITLASEMVKQFDTPKAECVSCKSGPFVAVDETEVLSQESGGPWLSDARPGKPVSVIRRVRITRRMLQTEPTVIRGSLADIEAAGWEEGEYGWTCKACTEKAAGFEGGAHMEDENACLLLARDIPGRSDLKERTSRLLARAESGQSLHKNGLLDLMTDHATQTEAAK